MAKEGLQAKGKITTADIALGIPACTRSPTPTPQGGAKRRGVGYAQGRRGALVHDRLPPVFHGGGRRFGGREGVSPKGYGCGCGGQQAGATGERRVKPMSNQRSFVENRDGVHLYSPFDDHTLCGDTDDGDTHKMIDSEPMKSTDKRVVTCERCAAIILVCRGVQVSKQAKADADEPPDDATPVDNRGQVVKARWG